MNSKARQFILQTSTPGTVSGILLVECTELKLTSGTPAGSKCPLFETAIFVGSMPRRTCRSLEVPKISCSTLVICSRYPAGNPYVSCPGDLEGDNSLVEVDETEFSVTCGCPTTPAPTVPATSSSVTDDDDDVSGETPCGETESFEITAASTPNLEG